MSSNEEKSFCLSPCCNSPGLRFNWPTVPAGSPRTVLFVSRFMRHFRRYWKHTRFGIVHSAHIADGWRIKMAYNLHQHRNLSFDGCISIEATSCILLSAVSVQTGQPPNAKITVIRTFHSLFQPPSGMVYRGKPSPRCGRCRSRALKVCVFYAARHRPLGVQQN